MDDAANGRGCGGVRGLNYMRVNVCGGGCLGVTQASRHCAYIGAVGDHKRRIGMSQRVERDPLRHADSPREIGEPVGEGRGIHGMAVPGREQPVMVVPFIAEPETLAILPRPILREHVKRLLW